jgi:hypothetical protein
MDSTVFSACKVPGASNGISVKKHVAERERGDLERSGKIVDW